MTDLYDTLEPGQRVQLEAPMGRYPGETPVAGERGTVLLPTVASAGGTCTFHDGHSTVTLDHYRVVSIRWDSGSWRLLIPEAGDRVRMLTDAELPGDQEVQQKAHALSLVKPKSSPVKSAGDPGGTAAEASAALALVTGHEHPTTTTEGPCDD